jgi:pSer/pThr/pTyr-binding forkhead associated (FHA) protein
MRRGPEQGRVYELQGDIIILGRGQKSDIVLHDNEVSRSHCRFMRVMDDYELHDMDSANGTFVNGQRVRQPWLLESDCIIELGDMITFQFERTGDTSMALDQVTEGQLPYQGVREEPTGKPFLVVSLALRPEEPEVIMLEEDTVTFGRDLSNMIVVQEAEVSRYHLRFTRYENGYGVQDLGSTNGSLMNGVPMPSNAVYHLKNNDVIQIGANVHLLYTDEPGVYRSMLQTDYLDAPPEQPQPSDQTIMQRPSITRSTETAAAVNVLGTGSRRRKTSQLGTGLAQGELEDHIFISYSRDDWERVVAPLVLTLQDAGLRVWVDQYLTPGADDWRGAVEQALTECHMMIVVVSPASMDSKNVTIQYRYFYNRERPIIALLTKPTDGLPPELIKQRQVRFDGDDRARSFQRVIFEIMQLGRG